MRIALIADTFAPLRSSAAVQLQDLVAEMLRQGHQPTVLVPSPELGQSWLREELGGVEVIRLKALRTKDVGYVRRTIAEFLMPFVMWHRLKQTPYAKVRWDGVVWYSPSIFLGPLSRKLKQASGCRAYLILRDIFPEWAVDMGLMGRGLPYRCFKAIERYQYGVADVIGVQTQANLSYFQTWSRQSSGRRVEVLQNWLAPEQNTGCSISLSAGPLAGRKVFVYAGNMGVAQGMGVLLDLAQQLRARHDIGFVFVGRGRDAQRLRAQAQERGLDNVAFYDEIAPQEIPGLYAQCAVGLVALDPRHKTHNVPGKFLSYMQCGLPVLATINPGNDLEQLINRERVGRACSNASIQDLSQLAQELVSEIASNSDLGARCQALGAKLFSPEIAVRQIISGLAH